MPGTAGDRPALRRPNGRTPRRTARGTGEGRSRCKRWEHGPRAAPSRSEHSPGRTRLLRNPEPEQSWQASECPLFCSLDRICPSSRTIRYQTAVSPNEPDVKRGKLAGPAVSPNEPGTTQTAVSPNEPDDGAVLSPNEPKPAVAPAPSKSVSPNEPNLGGLLPAPPVSPNEPTGGLPERTGRRRRAGAGRFPRTNPARSGRTRSRGDRLHSSLGCGGGEGRSVGCGRRARSLRSEEERRTGRGRPSSAGMSWESEGWIWDGCGRC
jgi:hypothetical protein